MAEQWSCRSRWTALATACACSLFLGCALLPPAPGPRDVAAGPDIFWAPPQPPPAQRAAPAPEIPQELLQKKWGLVDVLDIALRNNPTTRAAWASARAAAAAYGSARAAYLPTVGLQTGGTFSETHSSAGGTVYDQLSYGPTASLSWLLLDFGGRSASVESARQALLAADWTQNSILQGTVLQVEQAYYQYLAAEATLQASQATRKEAERGLDVAKGRHEAGVATIADVLQAKTALSQAVLAVQTAAGALETTRGALAASMGLPANLPVQVEPAPRDIPLQEVSQKVDDLIQEALTKRPDMAAARAQVGGPRRRSGGSVRPDCRPSSSTAARATRTSTWEAAATRAPTITRTHTTPDSWCSFRFSRDTRTPTTSARPRRRRTSREPMPRASSSRSSSRSFGPTTICRRRARPC